MSQTAELMLALRALVERAEAVWRAGHLPPPTRDAPRPDPAALRGAADLEAAGRLLDRIAVRLRAGPSRANETALLEHGEFLRALLDRAHSGAVPDPGEIHRSIRHLETLAAPAGAPADGVSGRASSRC